MLTINQSAAPLVAGVTANLIASGDIVPDYAHRSDQVPSRKRRGGQIFIWDMVVHFESLTRLQATQSSHLA